MGLICRPEETYRLCVYVCVIESDKVHKIPTLYTYSVLEERGKNEKETRKVELMGRKLKISQQLTEIQF